jgi:hypothetical protein
MLSQVTIAEFHTSQCCGTVSGARGVQEIVVNRIEFLFRFVGQQGRVLEHPLDSVGDVSHPRPLVIFFALDAGLQFSDSAGIIV